MERNLEKLSERHDGRPVSPLRLCIDHPQFGIVDVPGILAFGVRFVRLFKAVYSAKNQASRQQIELTRTKVIDCVLYPGRNGALGALSEVQCFIISSYVENPRKKLTTFF